MTSGATVRQRALGGRIGTAAAALAEMIRERQFLLSSEELALLATKDELIAGWVFAYRASQLAGQAQVEVLLGGLHDRNPHVREQACDVIGDRKIVALQNELATLFNDSVEYVAQSARYNHGMLAV
jgi:hypothetical protein